MGLNERQILILRYLLLKNEAVNYSELSMHCGCSSKTIQRDIKKIEETGKDLAFEIKRNGQGILLECNSEARNRLDELVFSTDSFRSNDSVEDRRNRIYLDLLLNSPNPTSIRSLSEKYFVGSSSIVNDLSAVEQWAQANGLTMKKTREGTYLQGNELLIRNEVAYLLNEIQVGVADVQTAQSRLNKETRMVLEGIYGSDSLASVEQCVSSIEESIDVILSDTYYVNIVTHILIAMERMKNKRFINESNVISEKDRNDVIFHKIKKCVTDFSNQTGIYFPENEVDYIYTHFMGCGVGELPSREVIAQTLQASNREVLSFCNELIQNMEKETSYSFANDSNLFYSLLLHVNSMITRIKYNVRIICLLKEKTIKEYPKMYATVKQVTLELKKKYFKEGFISDDEICYLCLYFQLALEDRKSPRKVLLICSTGVGTSHILKKRVQKVFPDLEITDVISLRQLEKKDLSDIDLIITTVNITKEIQCPSVLVSVLMDQRDIDEVKKAIVIEKKVREC